MRAYSRSLFVLLVALLGLSAMSVLAVQTDNHGIHAVPTPGKVTIDGILKDWDMSGQILQCYDIEALQDVYSGRIAMMYDTDNLYLAIRWKDPIPMGNSHDPHYQAGKGWAGDAVQLRIKTDRICHVTAWYYAAGKEPFASIDYGKSLTEPFGGGTKQLFRTDGWKLTDGAEMAFLKDADGQGYVQEMKLPWELITNGKQYQAGEKFACGIELLFGEADWPVHRYADNLAEGASSREFFWTAMNAWGQVFLEAKGNLKLPVPAYMKALVSETPQGPVEISYKLPYDARVTLAINDANGNRVRNLLPALPRKKGKNIDRWDGLDDMGKPVPIGRYTYTALYQKGVHANYIMSFNNPGNPTWQTSDGKGAFYGDHTSAQAAASAGDYVALGCPLGEAGQHLIGCDLTGQRLWGLANRVFGDGGHISLATDGKILWVAMEGRTAFIYRVDIATGRYAPWDAFAKDADGKDFQVLELPATGRAGYQDGQKGGDPAIPSLKGTPNMTAIALHNGVLAAALAYENKIDLRDANTGAVKASLAVEAPRAVTFDADGSLIVLSLNTLKRVALDGTVTPFTTGNYPAGYGLAIDANRNIYLSVRGDEQNVKVFSSTGKLIREIGAQGGRPDDGVFNANAMRNPGQIAIDAQGCLWVPEETVNPKRTSVWSLDGKLVKDLIGTTGYSAAGAINPDDPTMAFSENTIFNINLATGEWHPAYSLSKRDDPADIFPPVADGRSRTVTRNGIVYHYTTGSARGSLEMQCTLLKDGVWRSAAHMGIVTQRELIAEWAKYENPIFNGHDGEAYAWADQNGDGLVQPAEMSYAKLTWTSNYWGQLPGPDGIITFIKGQSLMKYAVTGFTACGAPIYDVANPKVLKLDRPLLLGGEGMVMGGSNGDVYINQDPLITVDDTGHVRYTYPSDHVSVHGSHTARAARPGYIIGPSSIFGTANFGGDIGELFYMSGNLGENYIFTADGLYVQTIFKDCRGGFETPTQAVRGMSFDATTAGGESFGGNFLRTPDGKCYYVRGGTDAQVLEITGLDTIKRFAGQINYTAKQYLAAQALAQQQAAKVNQPRIYTFARSKAPVTIDGMIDEWPELLNDAAAVIEVQESAQRRYGRVQARYDDQYLYLAYRVFGPNQPRNAGQDPLLYFKTGDCVDLMLGPSDGKQAGAVRLLFTVAGGKPMAALYEKSVPGIAAKNRVPFSSPWRTIYFDRVTVNPADVQVMTGPTAGGYAVEARVAWTRLGLKPTAGLKLKGDLGVLFADNGGTVTVSRQYWSNKATGLVNDVPGEADLTPNLWGDFTLE